MSDSSLQAQSVTPFEGRRSGSDRRDDMDRRRSAKGLFEVRARREGIAGDRRQGERRSAPIRAWRKLLQRFKR